MELREQSLTLREVGDLAGSLGFHVQLTSKPTERYSIRLRDDPFRVALVTMSSLHDVRDWLTE